MESRSYASLSELEKEYGQHKSIPDNHREAILQALSHFPELKQVSVDFLSGNLKVPLLMRPGPMAAKKRYTVWITEEADLPLREALLSRLPAEASRAAVAQQLGLILYYHKHGGFLRWQHFLAQSSGIRRKILRQADLIVIEHGLGFELYVHAVYIRKIPGYTSHNLDLDKYYLHPQEIMDTLNLKRT